MNQERKIPGEWSLGRWLLLGAFGVALAVAIALVAGNLADQPVGISGEPVSAGTALEPASGTSEPGSSKSNGSSGDASPANGTDSSGIPSSGTAGSGTSSPPAVPQTQPAPPAPLVATGSDDYSTGTATDAGSDDSSGGGNSESGDD